MEAAGGRDLSRLASGWLLSLFGIVCSGVVSFGFAILIGRTLGPKGAGVFFSSIALFSIIQAAAALGGGAGMIRTVSRLRALDRMGDVRPTVRVAVVPVICFSVALAGAVYALAPELSRIVIGGDSEAAAPLLRVLAPFLPVAAVSGAVLGSMRGLGGMAPFVAIEHVGKPALRLVLALVVVLAGGNATGLALAWAVPIGIAFIASTVTLVRLLSRGEERHAAAPIAGAARRLAPEYWRFASPLALASVLQIALLWLDTILLAALASPAEAGVYKAASTYVVQGAFASQAIIFVIGPLISALFVAGNTRRARAVYATATVWLTAIAWPIYLSMAVFAPTLMKAFGPEFTAGSTALVILALSMLVGAAMGPVSVVLVMGGKSSWNLLNVAGALGINVLLNILLIPRFGMTGAAVAWGAAIAFNNLAPLLQVRSLLQLHPFSSGLGVATGLAILCFGGLGIAARLVLGLDVTTFITFVLTATAVYALLLWRFSRALQLDVLRESLRTRRLRARTA